MKLYISNLDYIFSINNLLQNATFDAYILKIYIVGFVVLIQIYIIISAGEDVYGDVSKKNKTIII